MGLLSAWPGLARFQTVETDPDFRRQGLAGTLRHYAGQRGVDEVGAETLVIVADLGYHAIDLYRSVGFVVREIQLQVERAPDQS
jgi:ribosomal protein S18 acetylase RimI-like enzyme